MTKKTLKKNSKECNSQMAIQDFEFWKRRYSLSCKSSACGQKPKASMKISFKIFEFWENANLFFGL